MFTDESLPGVGASVNPDRAAIEAMFNALNDAGCRPRWRSNGAVRAFCPICGGGRSKSAALSVITGRTGRLVFTCGRCCGGIDKVADIEARRTILEALGLDPMLLGGACMPEAIERQIIAYRAALDRAAAAGAFKGQTGDSDFRMLRTAADFATRACSTTFRGSVRQFALDGGRGRTAAGSSLKRVTRNGWLKPAKPYGALVDRDEPGGFRSIGRCWTLAIPATFAAAENAMVDDSGMCPGTGTVINRSVFPPGGGAARVCSTGRAVWRTLEVLAGHDGPMAARDVAALTGLKPQTINKHFNLLGKWGAAVLIAPGARGRGNSARWQAVPGALEVLTRAGEHLQAAAAATFATERTTYAAAFDRALRDGGHLRVVPESGELIPPDSYADGLIVPVRVRRKPRAAVPVAVDAAEADPVIDYARRRFGAVVTSVTPLPSGAPS